MAIGNANCGPIDKLDVRIPRGAKFVKMLERELLTSNLTDSYRSTKYCNNWSTQSAMLGTKHYLRSFDLRPYGLNSILFFQNRRTRDHKLEILGAGAMSFSQIVSDIANTFEVDPLQADVMRIDLAVDVPHYSVEWFRGNVRVAQKRYTSEFGLVVWETKQFQTVYFGRRPNILRIYDKTGERRIDYKHLVRKWGSDDPIPSFEERYGHPDDAIITRVERQYGGGRVPKLLGTLGQLQKNAAELNPYEPLRFLPITISEDSIDQLSGDAYLKGQGLLRLVERHGCHNTKRILDVKNCRNTHRVLEQLVRSMPSNYTSLPPDLFFIYAQAMRLQLSD